MPAPAAASKISLDRGKTWTLRNPYPHNFIVDDLLYVGASLFVKLVHWDPAQADKFMGAILMSHDNGVSFTDITGPDMVTPLTFQSGIDWPREGLAATPTQLYVMSRAMGARAIALSSLLGQGSLLGREEHPPCPGGEVSPSHHCVVPASLLGKDPYFRSHRIVAEQDGPQRRFLSDCDTERMQCATTEFP